MLETDNETETMKIYTRAKDAVAGKKIGDVYVTKRKPFHVMRKTGGSFGISVDILEKIQVLNVEYVLFVYYGKTENCMFITSLERYTDYPDDTYTDNGDRQNHVCLRNMEKIKSTRWREAVEKLNNKREQREKRETETEIERKEKKA